MVLSVCCLGALGSTKEEPSFVRMMRVISLLGCATGVAAHASYMLEASRCSRDLSVGANIMGVSGCATARTPHA